MRWGRTAKENKAREDYLNSWHPWFAWHPVRLGWDEGQWVWLEKVARNCLGGSAYDDISRLDKKD